MAKIVSIGLANPKRRISQEEAWLQLNVHRELSPLEKKYYRRFMLDDGIQTRYLALPKVEDIFCQDQDQIIQRYNNAAPEIASESTLSAIDKAGVQPSDIRFLTTASCTGYLCPGLSSYILEKAGLTSDVSVLDIQGMGCGAALPALSTAVAQLGSTSAAAYAMVTCTEICSAAVYWDDDIRLILSNSIFGDGSASLLLTNDNSHSGPEVVDYMVHNEPDKRESLRFRIKNGKLHNVLSADIPEIAATASDSIVKRLLASHQLSLQDVAFWAIHPGGKKVLAAVADRLYLSPDKRKFSENVLKNYGNMSSPSVFFILGSIFREVTPRTGDYGIMLSFGAGFSCFAVLLRW